MKTFIIAAVTADGFIAVDDSQRATSWTTKADLAFFVKKTKEAGTVVMGRKTFETIGKPLADRRLLVMTSQPSSLATAGIEPTDETPNDMIARLQAEGVEQLAIAGGASVYRQFMAANLVDELFISVMPKLFGAGITLFDSLVDKDLELIDQSMLDDNTVLLHYRLLA